MRIDLSQELTEQMLSQNVASYINPDITLLRVEMTLSEALEEIKNKPIRGRIRYFYVVDADDHLIGVVTTKDLLVSSLDTSLDELVDREIIKARSKDSLKQSLEIISYYHLLSIPVVDDDNRLLGILEVSPQSGEQELSLKSHSVLSRDLFQFIGFSIEQHKWNSPWKGYKVRMPWLLCNLGAGLICAGIAHVFQQSLIKFVILAIFIPLVLTLCESVATQSMTLTLQMLHQPKLRRKQFLRRLYIEWKTVGGLGFTSAVCVALACLAWQTNWETLFVISISVWLSMLASATFGTVFPLMLHKLKLDPKVASGPLILMFTDICATTIYLGLSTLILVHLSSTPTT